MLVISLWQDIKTTVLYVVDYKFQILIKILSKFATCKKDLMLCALPWNTQILLSNKWILVKSVLCQDKTKLLYVATAVAKVSNVSCLTMIFASRTLLASVSIPDLNVMLEKLTLAANVTVLVLYVTTKEKIIVLFVLHPLDKIYYASANQNLKILVMVLATPAAKDKKNAYVSSNDSLSHQMTTYLLVWDVAVSCAVVVKILPLNHKDKLLLLSKIKSDL
jgi:hypothetical protein